MKNFIKGKWFPLTATFLIVAAVALVMAKFGWRITYAPELENSWDAISAVATWFGVVISVIGVIASFIAIWYAIQVPKKIADRQDKIALFEKRYECFQFFSKCVSLFSSLANNVAEEKIEKQCCHILGIHSLDELDNNIFLNKSVEFEYILHQMSFLFPGISENDTVNLYESLTDLLLAIATKKDIEKYKAKYMQALAKFRCYSNEIWDSVTISNIT